MKRFLLVGVFSVAVMAWLAIPAPAENAPPSDSSRQRNMARIRSAYEANLERYRNNPDMMVRPGLLADRKEQRVTLWAEATAIGPDEPVEFFLISQESGHDYEALAVALARPSLVDEALRFIGVPPGRPIDYKQLRMWPKGERVFLAFRWTAGGESNGVMQQAAAEALVLDKQTGQPLPADGLVFVGSAREPAPDGSTGSVYAADVFGPNSIASDYNEPGTVLDVPRQAEKSEVYGLQKPNPAYGFTKGQMIEVQIDPEHKDGRRRVADLTLRAAAPPGLTNMSIADIRFSLERDGRTSLTNADCSGMLAEFGRTTARGGDLFVTVYPGPELTLKAVQELFALLDAIQKPNGIRIEPPPPGQLLYRAFLPSEAFRERAGRPSQPPELHLSAGGDKVSGRLDLIDEEWADDSAQPTFKVSSRVLATAAALREALAARQSPPVLLVFAPETLTYGALLSFIGPSLASHPTVYVFLPLKDAEPPLGGGAPRDAHSPQSTTRL